MKSQKTVVEPLLITRVTARKMLDGMSLCQIIRLEKMGVLTPIRLNPNSPVAMIYYRYTEVVALANGGATVSKDDDTEVEEQEQPRVRRRKDREAGATR